MLPFITLVTLPVVAIIVACSGLLSEGGLAMLGLATVASSGLVAHWFTWEGEDE